MSDRGAILQLLQQALRLADDERTVEALSICMLTIGQDDPAWASTSQQPVILHPRTSHA